MRTGTKVIAVLLLVVSAILMLWMPIDMAMRYMAIRYITMVYNGNSNFVRYELPYLLQVIGIIFLLVVFIMVWKTPESEAEREKAKRKAYEILELSETDIERLRKILKEEQYHS